jgi:hypothetical protein
LSLIKSSFEITQPAENDGKYPQRFPCAKVEEPVETEVKKVSKKKQVK